MFDEIQKNSQTGIDNMDFVEFYIELTGNRSIHFTVFSLH